MGIKDQFDWSQIYNPTTEGRSRMKSLVQSAMGTNNKGGSANTGGNGNDRSAAVDAAALGRSTPKTAAAGSSSLPRPRSNSRGAATDLATAAQHLVRSAARDARRSPQSGGAGPAAGGGKTVASPPSASDRARHRERTREDELLVTWRARYFPGVASPKRDSGRRSRTSDSGDPPTITGHVRGTGSLPPPPPGRRPGQPTTYCVNILICLRFVDRTLPNTPAALCPAAAVS